MKISLGEYSNLTTISLHFRKPLSSDMNENKHSKEEMNRMYFKDFLPYVRFLFLRMHGPEQMPITIPLGSNANSVKFTQPKIIYLLRLTVQ